MLKKKIDVVIPTNRKLFKLKKLINHINNQVGNFKINIIIIHQSSNKKNKPFFLKKKNIFYKKITLQNLSNAKNEGIKLSKSSIIAFLDDDVTLSKDYFLKSFNFIKKKKCDLMFCRINKINSKKPLSRNMTSYDQKINYFNSSCCLSSSMWLYKNKKKAFLFDIKLGLGAFYGSADETDFIYSNLKHKRKVYYNSKAIIYHPEEFDNLNDYAMIFKKFISYGKGQGALQKKYLYQNKFLHLYLFIMSFIKSMLGIIYYAFSFNLKNIVKYFALAIGKIIGFIKYN